ncbi:MAG: ABC transporter permease [Nocardioides sp.]|nr:ABC transporter permease [Nocardioides sp.]
MSTAVTPSPAASASAAPSADVSARLRREQATQLLRSTGVWAFNLALTIVIVLALWQALLTFTDISPYVAKGPVDVWNFLFVTEEGARSTAAEHREALWALTQTSLKDSAIGFVVGMVVATVLAVLFTLSKTVEAGVMPLALLLRSIPLVSIAPVIILLTGRGSAASVATIGTIVVLFPALASVLFGLSRASPQSLDLVKVYGGSNLAALLKVAIPGALPSLFAAARVSVPGAVTGALLAEWLSTGKGVGGQIQKFNASAQFDNLWASVAIITFITLVLYNVVQLVENLVLARMGMTQQLS